MRMLRTSLLALTALTLAAVTFGQTQQVPQGTNVKYKGYIISRAPDSFTFKDEAGSGLYVVQLTGATSVKTYKKGAFRGGKEYGASYLLRGLRCEVAGKGNAEGAIVADDIRFEENDLQAAQSIEVRASVLEAEQAAQAENQKRLEGQMAENAAIAAAANAKTQADADAAMVEAARANARINGLNDFDVLKVVNVPFASGSSTLGPKAKTTIDDAVAKAKNEDKKAWMIAVLGFADSTGKTAKNKALSDRRATAVIDYLVTKHNLPMQRLIQPFGYGENNAKASNKTVEGRALNRRAEIRVLSNKGIAGN